MATLTDIAAACGVSSRWISQLIAEGVLPNYPRGKFDFDAMTAAYFLHRREELISKHHAPAKYRAALVQVLRQRGMDRDADLLEQNAGKETRGRYLPKAA
ncbi:hypothetical protein J8I29_06740 [Labrys sp. LIt4]|uniref:hypothetical protein n=1 Tax=Labrys sp. LIt4 TaxID=2821355 RepID=UPI001ADF329E|nr:hypothetical protein [Labrys sp. LIt4]MBP0578995.1 hypothetical protein [Labrys sp. LIt4]